MVSWSGPSWKFFFSYPWNLKVDLTNSKTKKEEQKCCREKASVTMAIFSYYGNLSINLAFICLFEVVFIETEHHDNQIDLKIFHKKFVKTQMRSRIVIISSLMALSITCIEVS